MAEQMRAVMIDQFGGPEVLRLRDDAPMPVQVRDEVLVRVHAAGVNPIDAKTRAGGGMSAAIPSLPWILGGDFAGIVERAPYELSPFQPGDEVFGVTPIARYPGTYAEFVSVPSTALVHKPTSLSMHEAAGIPLTALTAWAGVVELARVHTEQRMLIHAGAGGVGHIAVQLAKFYGAWVSTTASTRNHAWLRELGADQVIDYGSERFEDALTEPVDVVLDLVGNDRDAVSSRSLSVLRDGGLIINVPTGSWPTMHEDVERAGRALRASSLKLATDPVALRTIAQLIDQGDLRTHVDAVFPLREAAAAHEQLMRGHTRGKIMLDTLQ